MANRGTSRSKTKKQDAWTGDEFKKDEEKRLKKSGVEFITSGRGTAKFPVDNTKTSKKPKYRGKIHSGRGTSSN